MPKRYMVGEEKKEGEKLDGKGDVRNLWEGKRENFPKGLQNLHILFLHNVTSPSSERELFSRKLVKFEPFMHLYLLIMTHYFKRKRN